MGFAFELAFFTQQRFALMSGSFVFEWAFNRDGAVAKVFVLKNAADGFAVYLRFFGRTKQAGNVADVRVAEFFALAA